MTSVAVIAHRGKTLGGGLPELRRTLAAAGVSEPRWYEVERSRQAPKRIRKALDAGADTLLVWGGDGMVQRSIDVAAGSGATLGIIPAGTANLLATYLGIPEDVDGAVHVALHGDRRMLDVGVLDGERFAVMGGVGFDGTIMGDVDGAAKRRLGRIAYVRSGMKALHTDPVRARVKVDGRPWYDGDASCILFGNIGTVLGGLEVFPGARPDDGLLEVGVVNGEGALDWLRVLGRVVTGSPQRSPLVQMTCARKVSVRLDRPMRRELDGGGRSKIDRFKVRIEPQAIAVRVPSVHHANGESGRP